MSTTEGNFLDKYVFGLVKNDFTQCDDG